MKLYAIFGDPVSHSRSPLMHNYVFRAFGIKSCYTRIHLEDGSKLKEKFFSTGLSGANITVPHKEAAFQQCDEVRGIAAKIQAVNTIVNEDGRLIGYNTDAEGFTRAIESFGPVRSALILGAGGTARALSIALHSKGIDVSILNRSAGRLEYFMHEGISSYTWDSFAPDAYDMIINTTSAGLSDSELPVPENMLKELLARTKAAVDVIYDKETPFLREVNAHSLPYKDGSDMLLAQGVLANHLFLHGEYSYDQIEPAMRQSFQY